MNIKTADSFKLKLNFLLTITVSILQFLGNL